jgi:hypothetical protein
MKIAMLAATVLPLSSFAALGGAPVANASGSLVLRAATLQSVSGSAAASPAASPTAGNQPASAVTATAPYTMRQSVDANGVTIREYLLPANVVFAVTWQGPIRPNMRAPLGSYFTNYVAAGRTGVRGSGPLIEGNGDFRIESAGRLGSFSGMAWLPRLLPAGVRPGDLE